MEQIEHIVEHGHVSDSFMGLVRITVLHAGLFTNEFSKILVPLVEKVAEHLTAVDEAHDNQVSDADGLYPSPMLIRTDELCPRTRSWSHHTDSFVQFLSGCHCWLGLRQGDGFRPPRPPLKSRC